MAIFRSISPKTDKVIMSAAEMWIQEGVEKGIKQGMQQGVQQGVQQDVQQGERQATLRHIKGMLGLGLDAETIAAAFDLPLKTVKIYIATISRE